MLRAIAEDVWVVERPLRFLGLELGTRMTVVRLAGGELWVCSPIEPSSALRSELDALGDVRFIVAPNRFHHLFVGDFAAAYPEARVYGSPGIARKRKDLRFDAQLRTGDDCGEAIDVVRLEGMPILDELVFVHRPSETLVVTDLLMQLNDNCTFPTRWAMRAEGVHDRAAMPRSSRLLMVRDRAALRASVERILGSRFERIVLTHGPVVEEGGHALLERAMSWLME